MRRKQIRSVLLDVFVATTLFVGNAQATPATGFVSKTLALGQFGAIDVVNELVRQLSAGTTTVWRSLQQTQGTSSLYVQTNTWEPGGSTGWHSHPGHSLIIVTAGTVTDYEGHDRACTPHVYTPGMGFVDRGGDHVHLIRNEGTVPATTVAVQLLPQGAPRRIDAPAPGNCPF